MELWDIYDKNRVKTGRLHRRGEPLKKGDYHLVVHVWIVNGQNRILIQKRQPWKPLSPGMWETSASGSAIAGEDSLTAALREAKEELGIALDKEKAELVLSCRRKSDFNDIWLFRQDFGTDDLHLSPEEVADAKWADIAEIKRLLKQGEYIRFNYLKKLFKLI